MMTDDCLPVEVVTAGREADRPTSEQLSPAGNYDGAGDRLTPALVCPPVTFGHSSEKIHSAISGKPRGGIRLRQREIRKSLEKLASRGWQS